MYLLTVEFLLKALYLCLSCRLGYYSCKESPLFNRSPDLTTQTDS